MGIVLFLNGLSYLAVALMAFYIFLSFSKRGVTIRKIGKVIAVNGIFFLLFAFLNFSWLFKFLSPTREDFILMSFVVTVVSSILILYAVYKITNNRNLVYLFVLFLTTIFAVNFSMNSFFLISMAISYLLMTIVFLDIILFSNFYLKKAGFAGISYTIMSILFLVLVYLNFNPLNLLWFIPNSLMFFVFYLIFLDVKSLGIAEIKRYLRKKEHFAASLAHLFAKFLIFMISISLFMFLSVIGLHEFGHAMVAQYYGCEHTKAVIYDVIQAPHTEIICDSYYNDTLLTLGGVLSTFIIGLVFLLTGGKFTTRLSYLIFGFSLLIAYGDFLDLGMSKNIASTIAFLSLIIISIAIVNLSVHYLKQQNIFKHGIKKGIKKAYYEGYKAKKILKYEERDNDRVA